MRTVVTFLIIIDMIVMQRLNTEACKASSEESGREGIMAWGVTVIVGIILILILIFSA
mgnify:FL=1